MKKWIALLLAAMTAFTVIGCGGDTDVVPQQPIDIGIGTPAPEVSEQPEQDPGLGLTQAAAPIGMVDAAAVHTVGLRADGTAVTAGHDTHGQRDVAAWQGLVYIAAGEKFTAGVKNDGTVILAGEQEALADTAAWSNIASIAAGKAHLVGLKADGTVAAAGDNAAAQCDVAAWSDIVAVAAGDSFTLGLTAAGTVVSAGSAPDVSAWKNITAIDAGGAVAAGLVNDGTVVAAGADASALSGIASIAAGDFGVVGIKADGTAAAALADASIDLSGIANAADAAVGTGHAVFMLADGTVAAFGANNDLQCAVDQLFLRPHVEAGADAAASYMIGFRPGMTVQEASAILKATTGSESAAFTKADGTAPADTDPIATGLVATSDGVTPIATVVLMGDVNGDGAIDNTDGDLVQSYVESASKLEGAFDRASRARADSDWGISEKVTATLHGEEDEYTTYTDINRSVAGMIAIRDYASGNGTISQYGDWHTETSELSVNYRNAYAENDDTIGYITLDKTNISYPIMVDYNGKWYYNDHTFEKESSESASIYAYYYNYQHNNVVTGHNSRPSGSMFHQLHHIQEFNLGESNCVHEKYCGKELTDLPDLNNYAERVWTVNLYGVETRYEIFAMYETKAGCDISDTLYDNVWWGDLTPSDEASVQKWIDKQLSLSEIDIDTEVTTEDTFLTIFTCGNEHSDASKNARLYFFLKRVD